MLKIIIRHVKLSSSNFRCCSTVKENISQSKSHEFETVYKFPHIKYISLLNRLKVYQIVGTSIALPGCGLLETLNVVPSGAFLSASYIGLTGVAVMSLCTWPFKNIIGFLYISDDNTKVKISSMDFWGRRIDKTISADDWTPLLELEPRTMDPIYLLPKVTDGTKYKLFIKYGEILNQKKIGQVLE